MKNFLCQKSRQPFPDRFKRQGSLPDRRSIIIIVYSLLVFLPAFLVLSCKKDDPQASSPGGDATEKKDSAAFVIRFSAAVNTTKALDIFIYDDEGLGTLEKHISRADMPPSLEVRLAKGKKMIAAVANSPKKFKTSSMSRQSVLPQVIYEFKEDSRDNPIMSGSARTSGEEAEILLEPMLCTVVLKSISNTMDDYELLESPRVRLRSINAKASFFTEEEEYLPTETVDKGEWSSLPYDIGYYPQEVGIELDCYPNETPESSLGLDRTYLELECTIKGKKCSFLVDLPPFGRASRTEVELTVDGPGSFSYSFGETSSETSRENMRSVSEASVKECRTRDAPHIPPRRDALHPS